MRTDMTEQRTSDRRVVCAALKHPDGRIVCGVLTEELDTHLKVHLGVVRENVRLRAALKKLVDWTTEKTPGWAPLDQARAALAGHETTATPGAKIAGEASVASTAEASRPRGLPPEPACNCSEVCKICGGRAKACAILGHRPEADRAIKWHECETKPAQPERPVAWWRSWQEDGDEHREVAWGDWPPPEPDDTAWLPLYSSPEGRPCNK